MYGPDMAILLIYGSHDMRHAGFRRLTVVNWTPREMGRHTSTLDCSEVHIDSSAIS